MKNSILGGKIALWLRERDGSGFCDACIAIQVGEQKPKAVHRIVMQLARGTDPELDRFQAKCAACGGAAMVTIARRNLAWL